VCVNFLTCISNPTTNLLDLNSYLVFTAHPWWVQLSPGCSHPGRVLMPAFVQVQSKLPNII